VKHFLQKLTFDAEAVDSCQILASFRYQSIMSMYAVWNDKYMIKINSRYRICRIKI